MPDDIAYQDGGAELFDAIEPLWNTQRQHHIDVSTHFRPTMLETDWRSRSAGLARYVDQGGLRVDTAAIGGDLVGYCIATIDDNGRGDVQSLFVLAAQRGSGVGGQLLQRSLAWFRQKGCERITAGVAAGNEAVLPFYARHGLHPRTTILQVPPQAESPSA